MRYYLMILYCPQPAEYRLEVAYEVRFNPNFRVALESLSSLAEHTAPFSSVN